MKEEKEPVNDEAVDVGTVITFIVLLVMLYLR